MLQAIRDKVTGWIAYGIIFLISIPFALWGVNSYLGGGEIAPAATVNGEEISLRDFDQAYINYRQRLAQLFGGSIPAALADESRLRNQVLNQLIEEAALRQYVERQHYRIGDEALSRQIRDMDEFKRDGQFDPEIYEQQLRSIGLSTIGFEQRLRVNGSLGQFQIGIRESTFVTPKTRQHFANLQNQTRKIRSLNYQLDASSVTIDDADIEQYYLANTERYQTPEQVKIDYVELSLEGIKQSIEVAESDIEARYRDNIAAYTSAEFREASHILIKVDDATDEAAALARITEIRARIENGESFAELARELSQDPLSAADGGNLGEVGRGDMVPTFESALFALPINELSQPVKTGFGWHLIQVHSIVGGETQSYDSLKASLEDEIKSELAEVQIYELVERVANFAYEQSDSLEPAAEQFDLRLRRSDWFDRSSGTGIAREAKIRELAFSDDILLQGINSEAIELGDQRVVFIRLNERKAAQLQPLEQVKDRVRAELISQRLRERSLVEGKQALESLRAGKSLDELAQEWSVSVTNHGFVARDQADVAQGILRKTFSMPKPDQGLVFEGLPQDSGEYVIIELSAVLSNDAEADDAEASDNLLQALGGAEYQAVVKYLGARAEVVRTPLDEIDLGEI